MSEPYCYTCIMNTEIEATFLEVEHSELRQKLEVVGAQLVQTETEMRRTIYDYPDLRLDKMAAWIRVRDEGGRITMGFKHRQAETLEGMKEIEFDVSSYDDAKQFMEAIGLTVKAEQESRRETWEHDGCEIMLDTWPWIPPYVEVEGPSEVKVRALSEELGLDWDQAVFDSADGIYQKYYDVTRTEISTIPIKFGDVPDELAAKKI